MWESLPERPVLETQVSPEDPEFRKVTVLATPSTERPTLLECIEYFSDWHRAKRALAICLLFIERMKYRKERIRFLLEEQHGFNKLSKGLMVRVKDLWRAKLLLIKAVQSQAFPQEFEALRKRQQGSELNGVLRTLTKRSSLIHCINPILDEDGVLRVGG